MHNRIIYFTAILYNVSIYTGDRHGAGTDANVSILLKGERGDTGHRYLKKTANDADVFQVCVSFCVLSFEFTASLAGLVK